MVVLVPCGPFPRQLLAERILLRLQPSGQELLHRDTESCKPSLSPLAPTHHSPVESSSGYLFLLVAPSSSSPPPPAPPPFFPSLFSFLRCNFSPSTFSFPLSSLVSSLSCSPVHLIYDGPAPHVTFLLRSFFFSHFLFLFLSLCICLVVCLSVLCVCALMVLHFFRFGFVACCTKDSSFSASVCVHVLSTSPAPIFESRLSTPYPSPDSLLSSLSLSPYHSHAVLQRSSQSFSFT